MCNWFLIMFLKRNWIKIKASHSSLFCPRWDIHTCFFFYSAKPLLYYWPAAGFFSVNMKLENDYTFCTKGNAQTCLAKSMFECMLTDTGSRPDKHTSYTPRKILKSQVLWCKQSKHIILLLSHRGFSKKTNKPRKPRDICVLVLTSFDSRNVSNAVCYQTFSVLSLTYSVTL